MSNDYTFISDLNGGNNMNQAYPNPAGMPMQGGGMPMQGGGMPMQGGGMPGPDQFDVFRKYLAGSVDDSNSDSDSDSDSDSENNEKGSNWQHYYGIMMLMLLVVILYYVFKIRKELTGMYEEA
uniref:Transmembrane protein n=1 Tax=Marseillevirus LCMAC201 TaxID=2506605 RepID=A0A481YWS1_9VIRU|nr:MAG: hypothetical protein LCMAC201_03800 [Marseillevirus LCMAC201]